ncbi:hypothetical protein SPFL3101_02847 [Sporomusaceae bacterium FL31]|nr:hypothetical protein SPFL3101_02847 [Sporomusaceae bacterium FL31]
MARHILRQRKAQDLFNATDQQGNTLFYLAAIITFFTLRAAAAVKPVLKNSPQLVLQDRQGFLRWHVTVAQIDVFARQIGVEQTAVLLVTQGAQMLLELLHRLRGNIQILLLAK